MGVGEEGFEGGGMRRVCGVRKDEGRGDGYAEGEVAIDDGESMGFLGVGKGLRSGAEGKDIACRRTLWW